MATRFPHHLIKAIPIIGDKNPRTLIFALVIYLFLFSLCSLPLLFIIFFFFSSMHFIADNNFLRYLDGRIEFVSRVFRAVYYSATRFSSRLPDLFSFFLSPISIKLNMQNLSTVYRQQFE